MGTMKRAACRLGLGGAVGGGAPPLVVYIYIYFVPCGLFSTLFFPRTTAGSPTFVPDPLDVPLGENVGKTGPAYIHFCQLPYVRREGPAYIHFCRNLMYVEKARTCRLGLGGAVGGGAPPLVVLF